MNPRMPNNPKVMHPSRMRLTHRARMHRVSLSKHRLRKTELTPPPHMTPTSPLKPSRATKFPRTLRARQRPRHMILTSRPTPQPPPHRSRRTRTAPIHTLRHMGIRLFLSPLLLRLSYRKSRLLRPRSTLGSSVRRRPMPTILPFLPSSPGMSRILRGLYTAHLRPPRHHPEAL